MKKGQRVYLKHATYIGVLGGGVVSGADHAGFTVTWDGRRDEGKLIRGGKVRYLSSQVSNFGLGRRPFVQDAE